MPIHTVYDEASGGTVVVRHDTDPNSNEATLTAQAMIAFETNRAAIVRNTASVAVANPTNAQVVAGLKDALRQLSDLERQNNALMRLVLGLLDGTD